MTYSLKLHPEFKQSLSRQIDDVDPGIMAPRLVLQSRMPDDNLAAAPV